VPGVAPSHLYMFVAMIAVSTLLVASFMAYANTLRLSAEVRQLENLMDHVAAKSTELLVLTMATNASCEAFLQMPTAIGVKEYWLQLHNDSAKAWLDGGLGNVPTGGAELRVYLPNEALAIGHYVGGYGAAHLRCEIVSDSPQIQLTNSSAGV